MITDPCLRFWMHAAQSEGALYEFSDDVARALLPTHLREEMGLPELISVTADPDAAEEEPEAIFLIPGHPVLEKMSARVIANGDVGHAYFLWPASLPPAPASLLERARAMIDVEHGRIDLATDPVSIYWPLLRLGVLVTYSLDDHFHEREELWVDACTGAVLDAPASSRLRALPFAASPAAECSREQDAQLGRAFHAAHDALLDRIALRSAALVRQSQGTLRDELTRSETYYGSALAALGKRRAGASPDRQNLLDKQAEVIHVERARRRHEIEAKFNVSYTLQPYRAHLLLVPALAVPVVIRRGERRYPFELCWLLPLSGFAPQVCPSCGAQARLIAERERLACATCARRQTDAALQR